MTDDFKIEKGIPIPPVKSIKNVKAYEFIKTLELGDSFVVRKDKSERPPESKANSYVQVGKKLGKKLVTRKIYSEENPNDFYIRIWFTEEMEPVTKKYKRKRIYTSDVANPDITACRLPNDILFLAEQNEENKEIVEDIRRLNKILIEELAKQNIELPKGE